MVVSERKDDLDQLTLPQLFVIVIKNKKRFFGYVATSIFVAVVYIVVVEPKYSSEVVLAPNMSSDGALSSLPGSLSNVASLAGINLSSIGGDIDYSLEVLKSKTFIIQFINENNLKPLLFEKRWDSNAALWKPENRLKMVKRWVASKFIAPSNTKYKYSRQLAQNEPTDLEAYEEFSDEYIRYSEDDKGLLYLVIKTKSPDLSYEWTMSMVRKINKEMQQLEIARARKSLLFLHDELSKTSTVEIKESIFELIESQTKTIMLASVKDEFAFRVIDFPVFSDEPDEPKFVVVFMFCVILGVGFSFLHNWVEWRIADER